MPHLFTSFTGDAKVIIEAKDDIRTVSQTINVTVQKPATSTPVQVSEFKNQGQVISYLTHRLQSRDLGSHKNLGQALKSCKEHPGFHSIKTAAGAEKLLDEIIRAPATMKRKQNTKRAF